MRIPEVSSRDAVPAEQRHVWDAIVASRGSVRGPFAVLMHSPEAAARVAHLGTFIRFESSLDPASRELAALVTAHLLDCEYERAAHERLAREAGVPDAVLDAVRAKQFAAIDPAYGWVCEFARQLVVEHRVAPAAFDAARERLDTRGLVELVATIGYYANIAAVLDAFTETP
ncbi:MAG TPA: carboxymuconolactone decarboxylase family protein [Chloroflexota bacterium]|nr:carboxymuconolactone decarboxylase family protein [Chloroflexota bacterium]